jgi:hypothetical protein
MNKSNDEESEESQYMPSWSRRATNCVSEKSDNSVDFAEEGLEDSSVFEIRDPYRKCLVKGSFNFHFLVSSPHSLFTGQEHS